VEELLVVELLFVELLGELIEVEGLWLVVWRVGELWQVLVLSLR
jgi:hypothetical protein